MKNKQLQYDPYEQYAIRSLNRWRKKIDRSPSIFSWISSGVQHQINRIIPEKIHKTITIAVKEIIKNLITGTKFIAPKPKQHNHLKYAEDAVRTAIKSHKTTGAIEGGLTGLGGFLWGLADFPLLLSIKIKLLQSIAAQYGYDTNKVTEKIFLLLIIQQAFSSDKIQRETYYKIIHFEKDVAKLPENINELDWRTLQQQYRDYLDIAKLLQMIPIIGAVVGTVANFRLINRLGKTAMQCYRIRYFQLKNNAINQRLLS